MSLHTFYLKENDFQGDSTIDIIYPGYSPGKFKTSDRYRLNKEMRREPGLDPNKLFIGLVTSGDFAKRGASLFLEVLARLSPSHKQKIQAGIIGREKNLSSLRKLARKTNLSPLLQFYPPHPDVEKYDHALDIYILN